METEITPESGFKIDFGASGIDEIFQNVRMLLATTAFSCPMARDFAWSGDIVDTPINRAKATAEIVAAIQKYEPRVQVVGVDYQADLETGQLKPTVKIRVVEDEQI